MFIQCRYIKDYAKICLPLYDLLKKDTEFVWSEECQNAIDKLKARIMNNVMLAYPKADQPFYIFADASDKSIGSGTFQKDEQGQMWPVALLSAKLNPTQ